MLFIDLFKTFHKFITILETDANCRVFLQFLHVKLLRLIRAGCCSGRQLLDRLAEAHLFIVHILDTTMVIMALLRRLSYDHLGVVTWRPLVRLSLRCSRCHIVILLKWWLDLVVEGLT